MPKDTGSVPYSRHFVCSGAVSAGGDRTRGEEGPVGEINCNVQTLRNEVNTD